MPPHFGPGTTAEQVAGALANDISGKNVLVTGTSMGGLGFETARSLAPYANLVILAGYNKERLSIAEEAITREFPAANVRKLLLDLSCFADIRRAAAEINQYPEPLHVRLDPLLVTTQAHAEVLLQVIIHNAAAPIGPFCLSADGLESQVAIGHIGPFLLTKLILPRILAAENPRIVYVSSLGHRWVNKSDLDWPSSLQRADPESFSPWKSYALTKVANVITAREVFCRSNGEVEAFSVHPGVIFTNIHKRAGSLDAFRDVGVLDADGRPQPNDVGEWKSVAEGAATTVFGAFAHGLEPGAYLANCAEANQLALPCVFDRNLGESLWSATEGIIGEDFSFEIKNGAGQAASRSSSS
ncbi:Short-chain dehydrogenase/reductase family protein [Mycena kentingensis (nom. inval.)]|nr:Short-chain dehydrogenase/reductase family protein [Mycena kentingensis (nom. inval.)]